MPNVKSIFSVKLVADKLKAITSKMTEAPNGFVDVGIFQGQIATYALYNEFGTSTIPERSFLRSTFDENRDKYSKILEKGINDVHTGRRVDLKSALTVAGIRASNDIKRKITSLRTPPNAPATIARKGSSNPLIDTGAMRNAVTYEVHEG